MQVNRFPSLAAAKAAKVAEINAAADAALAGLSSQYGRVEVSSWPRQVQEAQAFAADPAAVTPLLDGAAAERGLTRAQMASRIETKAAEFAASVATVIGKAGRLRDQVNAAATVREVVAVNW